MSRSRREEVIEEVEWLLSFRTYPASIAERLGYKNSASLARALYRHGRPDLGMKIEHLERTDNECILSTTGV